jgi:AraC-like DNA-binding protein
VRFRQTWCGFELPHRLADRRIESADPETRRIAAKYLESNYLPRTASLSDRVAELTRRLLPTGQCSVDAIADQLAMHPRSLQRRLATEGVRCQDLIERERRARAARYLAEPGLHLSQIAGLLGYTEQSTLNHSCRRWFGKTPSIASPSSDRNPMTLSDSDCDREIVLRSLRGDRREYIAHPVANIARRFSSRRQRGVRGCSEGEPKAYRHRTGQRRKSGLLRRFQWIRLTVLPGRG